MKKYDPAYHEGFLSFYNMIQYLIGRLSEDYPERKPKGIEREAIKRAIEAYDEVRHKEAQRSAARVQATVAIIGNAVWLYLMSIMFRGIAMEAASVLMLLTIAGVVGITGYAINSHPPEKVIPAREIYDALFKDDPVKSKTKTKVVKL